MNPDRNQTISRTTTRRQKLTAFHVCFSLNGVTVNYARVEYDDGTFKETGLPLGCVTRPTLGQLWEWAQTKSRTMSRR